MFTPSLSSNRLPEDYRKSLKNHQAKSVVKRVLRQNRLNTVCEEARCPNIGECFSNNTATFMIMGDRCTRRCHFCSITTKKPLPLDPLEGINIAKAAHALGLDYVVITSVDRDELKDHGASHFIRVINQIHEHAPHIKVELLTPDFKGKLHLVDDILACPIEVFGHNIETIERLYKKLRPQSNFDTTKKVLKHATQQKKCLVKTGMMVGLGETDDEVLENLHIIKDLGVDIVTIGQYLPPSLKHWPVNRFVSDNSFELFKRYGQDLGFRQIYSGKFVRSSYHAKEVFLKL